ncbi:hypothetical protein EDC14_102138 [Hydrogenispora ethanolica]|uniref:Uncharacterized protein n=1 Tax=Hydrogenispora ethanolica TaxID=1082276 RepID=A0A4R1RCK2_HYDET|nr:hypothetical protein [Hydrogenispora ethanolica]TCL63320.1 hypothetical protein EDC14_102138 [Hydrogenispora ethanolica]
MNEVEIFEMLSAVKWYFELKNLSLKNALALRCPLSVENQSDLRQYYSQYFAGLLSATELFREQDYPYNLPFNITLKQKLSFEGFPDGEYNYSYLRELRNSIIHRGLNISSAVHIKDNFPLLISPSPVKSRSGKTLYKPFGFYLIEIIQKCEKVIGDIFLTHFTEFELLKKYIPQEKTIELSKKAISESIAMPDWVKTNALKVIGTLDHEKVQRDLITDLVKILKFNVISVPIVK